MENQTDYILKLVTSGLSIIPIEEGAKRPAKWFGKTESFIKTRATSKQVTEWINKYGTKSWGLFSGAVSGNVATLDFDEKWQLGMYDAFYAKLSTDQRTTVDLCVKNKTRNNGTHIICKTDTPQKTTKIANGYRLAKDNKPSREIDAKMEMESLIETRGEGSYALIPPSDGYATLQGDLLNIPNIGDDMWKQLCDIARTFNEITEEPVTEYEYHPADSVDADRPGDRLNRLMTWKEILEPHGWIESHKNAWTRPGKNKTDGISATTDYDGRPYLYIFSTATEHFEANRGYSKFHAFTLLNHGGDFRAAAKDAAEKYPQDNTGDGDNQTNLIEVTEKMLEEIPLDTAKVKLIEKLGPIFQHLIKMSKITAEAFIQHNIYQYFHLTREDTKNYIAHLNALRARSIKKAKENKKEKSLPLILDRDIDFQEAYDAVLEIGIVSVETFKILTGIIISAQLRLNPPLWAFFIGVPSSFKTELVGLYSDMVEVFTLDTLTENAFASGFLPADGSDPQDLLPLLDTKCFIIKDLNTLFSMNEELVKKILGDLTSIFDGKFQKFTDTRGMVEYYSLFSMIGCITPSMMIKHYNYATQLGPRFFFLRLPELTEKEMGLGFDRSWSETDRKLKIIETRRIISSYATQLIRKIKEYKAQPETKKVQKKNK